MWDHRKSLSCQIITNSIKRAVQIWTCFYMTLRAGEFKKTQFETPLKTLTHMQWLRDAEHKGHGLTHPRVWKGQNLCAIWKRGSVIPACQYNFIMSFSPECYPPNIVCWIIDRGRLTAELLRPSRSWMNSCCVVGRTKNYCALVWKISRKTEPQSESNSPVCPVWGELSSPDWFECALIKTNPADSIDYILGIAYQSGLDWDYSGRFNLTCCMLLKCLYCSLFSILRY